MMNDSFDQMKNMWQLAKTEKSELASEKEMLSVALDAHRKSKKAHRMNIIILSITCVVMAVFLTKILRLSSVISYVGTGLMLGSLVLRIVIEIYSQLKAAKIEYGFNTLHLTEHTIKFYEWRKKVHGTITILIVVLYSIGFYLLTPEFLMMYSKLVVFAIDAGYFVIAVILFFSIRAGVIKEMNYLKKIILLKSDLN